MNSLSILPDILTNTLPTLSVSTPTHNPYKLTEISVETPHMTFQQSPAAFWCSGTLFHSRTTTSPNADLIWHRSAIQQLGTGKLDALILVLASCLQRLDFTDQHIVLYLKSLTSTPTFPRQKTCFRPVDVFMTLVVIC